MSTLKLRTVCLVLLCLTLLASEASSKPTKKTSKSKGKGSDESGSSAYASSSASSTGTSKKTGVSSTKSVKITDSGISSSASATGTGKVSASVSASSQAAYHGKPTRRKSRGTSKETKTALATCTGITAYKCCRNTSSFQRTDDGVYCGCTRRAGSGQLCHFEVIQEAPLVVKRIFGINTGELCQCSESSSKTSIIATT